MNPTTIDETLILRDQCAHCDKSHYAMKCPYWYDDLCNIDDRPVSADRVLTTGGHLTT